MLKMLIMIIALAQPPASPPLPRACLQDGAPCVAPPALLLACRPALCGMDSSCVCHSAGGQARCWSTSLDCNMDLLCCIDRGNCHGMATEDACMQETAAFAHHRKGVQP